MQPLLCKEYCVTQSEPNIAAGFHSRGATSCSCSTRQSSLGWPYSDRPAITWDRCQAAPEGPWLWKSIPDGAHWCRRKLQDMDWITESVNGWIPHPVSHFSDLSVKSARGCVINLFESTQHVSELHGAKHSGDSHLTWGLGARDQNSQCFPSVSWVVSIREIKYAWESFGNSLLEVQQNFQLFTWITWITQTTALPGRGWHR